MKKNWEVFINYGLVVYLRVCTLTKYPFKTVYILLFVISLLAGVIFPQATFNMLLGGSGPGALTRLIAGDFSFISNKVRPEIDEDVFYKFGDQYERLADYANKNENAQLWDRKKIDELFKPNIPYVVDTPPIAGIPCSATITMLDLVATEKGDSQFWSRCKQAEDIYYYAGIFNASNSNYKDIRYYFYAVRKQPTAATRDAMFGKEYEWVTYAINMPSQSRNFYKPNNVEVVNIKDIAYSFSKSFPEGFEGLNK